MWHGQQHLLLPNEHGPTSARTSNAPLLPPRREELRLHKVLLRSYGSDEHPQ